MKLLAAAHSVALLTIAPSIFRYAPFFTAGGISIMEWGGLEIGLKSDLFITLIRNLLLATYDFLNNHNILTFSDNTFALVKIWLV